MINMIYFSSALKTMPYIYTLQPCLIIMPYNHALMCCYDILFTFVIRAVFLFSIHLINKYLFILQQCYYYWSRWSIMRIVSRLQDQVWELYPRCQDVKLISRTLLSYTTVKQPRHWSAQTESSGTRTKRRQWSWRHRYSPSPSVTCCNFMQQIKTRRHGPKLPTSSRW